MSAIRTTTATPKVDVPVPVSAPALSDSSVFTLNISVSATYIVIYVFAGIGLISFFTILIACCHRSIKLLSSRIRSKKVGTGSETGTAMIKHSKSKRLLDEEQGSKRGSSGSAWTETTGPISITAKSRHKSRTFDSPEESQGKEDLMEESNSYRNYSKSKSKLSPHEDGEKIQNTVLNENDSPKHRGDDERSRLNRKKSFNSEHKLNKSIQHYSKAASMGFLNQQYGSSDQQNLSASPPRNQNYASQNFNEQNMAQNEQFKNQVVNYPNTIGFNTPTNQSISQSYYQSNNPQIVFNNTTQTYQYVPQHPLNGTSTGYANTNQAYPLTLGGAEANQVVIQQQDDTPTVITDLNEVVKVNEKEILANFTGTTSTSKKDKTNNTATLSLIGEASSTQFTNINTTVVESNGSVLSLPGYLNINASDFRIGEKIGKGGAGEVYVAEIFSIELQSRCKGRGVVAKKLKTETADPFVQEVSILGMFCNHPNIATIVGYYVPNYIILLIRCEGKSLEKWIGNRLRNLNTIFFVEFGIVNGLSALHACGIAHNDIKPGNILIESDGSYILIPKITDFGVSTVVDQTTLKVKAFEVHNSRGISIHYAAPEKFGKGVVPIGENRFAKFHKQADLYSMSIVLFEMICAFHPWKKRKDRKKTAAPIPGDIGSSSAKLNPPESEAKIE